MKRETMVEEIEGQRLTKNTSRPKYRRGYGHKVFEH
jgi:hypothetical protein